MNTEVTPEPCIFCGRPAQPQVHHGRPEDTSQGKGAGGTSLDWPEHDLYDICDEHHTSLHAKKWRFRSVRGMIEILAPGDDEWVIGRRGQTLSVWATNKLCWTDDKLAHEWGEADGAAISALEKQCEIAWALKERYAHTTHKWYERAADILMTAKSARGRHIHWRRVYERVGLFATFGPTEGYPRGRWTDLEKLGISVALAVAKLDADERPAALEVALDMNADFKPAQEISAALKGDPVADRANPACEEHEWRCKHCGVEKGS